MGRTLNKIIMGTAIAGMLSSSIYSEPEYKEPTERQMKEIQQRKESELTLKLNSRCQEVETIIEGTKYEYLSHYLPGISQAITELNNISSIPFEKYKDPAFYIATLMEIMGPEPLKRTRLIEDSSSKKNEKVDEIEFSTNAAYFDPFYLSENELSNLEYLKKRQAMGTLGIFQEKSEAILPMTYSDPLRPLFKDIKYAEINLKNKKIDFSKTGMTQELSILGGIAIILNKVSLDNSSFGGKIEYTTKKGDSIGKLKEKGLYHEWDVDGNSPTGLFSYEKEFKEGTTVICYTEKIPDERNNLGMRYIFSEGKTNEKIDKIEEYYEALNQRIEKMFPEETITSTNTTTTIIN